MLGCAYFYRSFIFVKRNIYFQFRTVTAIVVFSKCDPWPDTWLISVKQISMHLGLTDQHCFCLFLCFGCFLCICKNDLEKNLALIMKKGKDSQLVNENHSSVLWSQFPAPVSSLGHSCSLGRYSQRPPRPKVDPACSPRSEKFTIHSVLASSFPTCSHWYIKGINCS